MTKPGNSGSEEPKQAEQTSEPEPTETTPVEEKPAEAKSEEAEPEEEKPAKAERAEAKAAAAKASADEDDEPLMVELEKAPPPPREETLRAKSSAAPRRFDEPPPRTLKFSFYFFVAAGLVWVMAGAIFLFNKQTLIDAQIAANDRRDITAEQIASALNQLLWFYLVIALIFAVFLGLFGWKAVEGTRRARTLVTIFAAIMVIFHLLLFSTPLGILSAMLALIALALIWSRTARAYFPPRQPLS